MINIYMYCCYVVEVCTKIIIIEHHARWHPIQLDRITAKWGLLRTHSFMAANFDDPTFK